MKLKLELIRDISKKECPWLIPSLKKGDIVYECVRHTYGCISGHGTACTYDPEGDYPFFELPTSALKPIER